MATDPRRAMATVETTIVLLIDFLPLFPFDKGANPYHLSLIARNAQPLRRWPSPAGFFKLPRIRSGADNLNHPGRNATGNINFANQFIPEQFGSRTADRRAVISMGEWSLLW